MFAQKAVYSCAPDMNLEEWGGGVSGEGVNRWLSQKIKISL